MMRTIRQNITVAPPTAEERAERIIQEHLDEEARDARALLLHLLPTHRADDPIALCGMGPVITEVNARLVLIGRDDGRWKLTKCTYDGGVEEYWRAHFTPCPGCAAVEAAMEAMASSTDPGTTHGSKPAPAEPAPITQPH